MNTNISSADLKTWNVDWKDVSDIVICRHELIHTRVFLTSSYGHFQVLIKQLSELIEQGSDLWEQALYITYEMYKESKFAHEVVATYCSVKMLDNDLIEMYLKTLSKEYLSYYNCLAYLIDPYIKCTYLQYLIGELLLRICFDSNVLEDIRGKFQDFQFKVDKKNSPNSRLELILSTIQESDFKILIDELQDLVRQNYRELGIPENFDFQNEKDWHRLEQVKLRNLNDKLGSHIYDYFKIILVERHGLRCITEGPNNGILEIANELGSSISEKWLRYFDLANLEISNLAQEDIKLIENKYINDSVINNKKIYNFDDVDINDPSKKMKFYDSKHWPELTENTLIHLDPVLDFKENCVWIKVRTKKNDARISAISLDEDMYLNELNIDKQRKNIDTHIIGVSTSCLEDSIESIESKLVTHLKTMDATIPDDFKLSRTNRQRNKNRHLEPIFKKNIWYMHGDFVSWFNFILSFKKLNFFVVHFDDKNTTNREILTEGEKRINSAYFCALVFYSDMLPGAFIRYYNISTFGLAIERIMPFIDNGIISVKEDSTRRYYNEQVIRSFSVIESVWDKY
ncbi:hypothetical protein [Bacillus thuringiensis]|uniref:hypothetical protein n=1 Tax=Bacillus thuringiensis TaxID=1428 RepID=UPI00119FDDB3|nr:hypothetical protein [Bacillus thuringiensis]